MKETMIKKTKVEELLLELEAMETSRHAFLRRAFGRWWPMIERIFYAKPKG